MKLRLNPRQLVLYVVGFALFSLAVCLTSRSNLGISPVTSVAYIFTFFTPLSLGVTQLIWNLLLFLIQLIWLGRAFPKLQYLQLIASLLLSAFIDLIMPFTAALDGAHLPLAGRFAVLIAGVLLMGFALSLLLVSRLVLLPGDGFARVFADKVGLEFGKGKVLTDSTFVILTILVSFAALGRLESVGIGTVIAALAVGNVARLSHRTIDRRISAWVFGPAEPYDPKEETPLELSLDEAAYESTHRHSDNP